MSIAQPNAFPEGKMFELHPPGEWVSDYIRQAGDFYERPILDEIRARLDAIPPGVIVDAGAMIGNHTVYFAAFVRHTRIEAFEPLPANLELLRRNVAPYPSVTIHQAALSDWPQWEPLQSEPDNLGHARIEHGSSFYVWADPLDLYGLDNVSLIKIDVEGHERQVLDGRG